MTSRRAIVLVIFLGAGALGYWLYWSGPKTSTLSFVLTDMEVQVDGSLLRHEHVRRLRCEVMNESGEVLATITHKRPGAVSAAAELRIPNGRYMLHIELTLEATDGAVHRQRYLKTVELDGEPVSLRL